MEEQQTQTEQPSSRYETTLKNIRIQTLKDELVNLRPEYEIQKKNVRNFAGLAIIAMIPAILSHANIFVNSLWLQIPLWLVFAFFALATVGTNPQAVYTRIKDLEANLRILEGLPDSSQKNNEYFNSLVNINIENLQAYYVLVKTHSSQSFRVSLMVCIIGFVLIATGLAIGLESEGDYIGYISTAAGVLVEFIAGALFYLYNKTVRQLKEYHDSLIEVQNVLLSFKLIDDTTDPNSKTEMVTKMIEYLVQKK